MENNTNKNNNTNIIASAIIIAGVLITGAILLKDIKPKDKASDDVNAKEEVANFNDINIKSVDENDHILGDKDAIIKIVEYSDTECPYCRIFHTTMHKVVEATGGKVAWVYRHFPILELHSNALVEAIATECAFEQGGNDTFWKYVDGIYAKTESKNNFTEEKLKALAKELNLDMESFNTCLDTLKYNEKVEKDMTDGVNAGVRGTPSNFILKNGKIVDMIGGAGSYEAIMQKINALMK